MSAEQRDDAPKRAQRDDKEGKLAIVGRSILIDKPRQELFAFWRDFTNLPQFMHTIERVETIDAHRSRWFVKAPVGQEVMLETETIDIVQNQSIGWRSTKNSQVETTGSVSFTDAPAGRGTIVTADIAYKPPGGDIGRLFAKLFQAEPNIQARHELKRFKMLMETGEIATGAFHTSETGDS